MKEAKYRQITAQLRSMILKGELQPGTRLPTALKLAQEWGTNYFTIQLALKPLVNEGLIERRPRLGTFIRDRSTHVASAAIYFGGNLWHAEQLFYQLVYQYLEAFYRERRGRSVLFVDNRLDAETTVPLPELKKAVDQREVQGVIGMMLARNESYWLKELPVPVSLLGTQGLHQDPMELFEMVLTRFASDGCRTVGMIWPRYWPHLPRIFKNLAQRKGLKTRPEWVCNVESYKLPMDFAGYRLFKDLWSNSSRPEGVFVFPDMACRGVVVAALELGLQIPRDVRFIFHRNTGIDYLCPWDLPFVVTNVQEVAHILASFLDAQYRHETTLPPIPTYDLVDGPRMIG